MSSMIRSIRSSSESTRRLLNLVRSTSSCSSSSMNHARSNAQRYMFNQLQQSSQLSSSSPSSSHRSFTARSGPSTPHSSASTASPSLTSFGVRETNKPNTKEWRLYVTQNGKDISPWHDIPLLADGSSRQQLVFHYINEIPKDTRPKMEIATKESGNPIKQDIKKEKLRLFTYGDLPFNYGCFPQTWENPHESHPLTGANGDNDPVDVVEISSTPLKMGGVYAVKVLGVLALLDEGETDWKIIAIDVNHPQSSQLNSMSDVDLHFPHLSTTIREWFRNYKTTDGKPINQFAFEEKIKDVGLANQVVWETHAAWAALCKGEIPSGSLSIPKEVPAAARG